MYLKEVVMKTIEEFTNLLSGKNISLESHLSEFNAITDENKFKQILINLISNAYKFTSPGGKIIVRLKKSSEPNYFQVSVEDN